MIGVDTNVLVRYITQDDLRQTPISQAFLQSLTAENPGHNTLVVIAELCWVLNRSYKLKRPQFSSAIQILLTSDELVIQDKQLVIEALYIFSKSNADFDDCLIERCSKAAGCDSIVTFDRNAAKAAGMQLLT